LCKARDRQVRWRSAIGDLPYDLGREEGKNSEAPNMAFSETFGGDDLV